MVSFRVHDLVRIEPQSIAFDEDPPAWVHAALAATPWAVVRRAQRKGWIAIGIRGLTRAQRCAAWIGRDAIELLRTPESLAQSPPPRGIAAYEALRYVRTAAAPLPLRWGPVGAVGFALATASAAVHRESDLDLVLRPAARPLLEAFAKLLRDAPARCDALVEYDDGGVALADLLNARGRVLLRTRNGPRFAS